MSEDTRISVSDSLQKEFCPSLDTSLVLALLSDINLETKEEIDSIRETLRQLASESEVEETLGLFPSESDLTTETETLPTSISTSSETSAVDFLRTVLPHIPLDRLRKAVADAETERDQDDDGVSDSDIDMWEIIAGLLTEEAVREMEERGLEEEESTVPTAIGDWELVTNKNKTRKGKQKQKPLKLKANTTFSIADIRQQHRLISSPSLPPSDGGPSVDPWTQINSLSTYLSTLLAPHEPSFFQSYFHSPEYESPYEAILAAVVGISENQKDKEVDPVVLVSLLDVLLPTTSTSSLSPSPASAATTHSQAHASTIELCLKATNGRTDDALDLVLLLQDLAARPGGLCHTNPNLKTKVISSATADSSIPLLHQITPTPISPLGSRPQAKPKPKRPSPPTWQTVSVRNPRSNAGGSGSGIDNLRDRIEENLRRRNEMLHEASRMWRRGGTSGAGAIYFAERAREFQELARKDSLSAARLLIESNSKRSPSSPTTGNGSGDGTTVDLHGTTVSEATQIVLEMLGSDRGRSKLPMKIITGRGTHSKGRVSVLKPAVKKALVEEGWMVSEWEGGLVVRRRR